MIGAIVYELQALNRDSIPEYNGQQLHGICFKILEEFSPDISTYIHEKMSIKPFTSAELELSTPKNTKNKRRYITEGELVYWRVTALTDDVLQAFLSVKPGQIFAIGNLQLRVEDVIISSDSRSDVGLIDPVDMVAECFSLPPVKQIIMNFHSVTSFRTGTNDFPWPLPEMVFGSLADKWEAMNMPGVIAAKTIRREAAAIIPGNWHGTSRKIIFSPKRSVIGFIGSFTYQVNNLNEEVRQAMLTLAAYAEFAGIGRWTAHGLGQVRMSIR